MTSLSSEPSQKQLVNTERFLDIESKNNPTSRWLDPTMNIGWVLIISTELWDQSKIRSIWALLNLSEQLLPPVILIMSKGNWTWCWTLDGWHLHIVIFKGQIRDHCLFIIYLLLWFQLIFRGDMDFIYPVELVFNPVLSMNEMWFQSSIFIFSKHILTY